MHFRTMQEEGRMVTVNVVDEAAIGALLTRRDLEVVQAVVAHGSQVAAARALGVTPRTVQHHLRVLRWRFDTRNVLTLLASAGALDWDPATLPAKHPRGEPSVWEVGFRSVSEGPADAA
jgi:DNA-binding CsgD family transcriptional regulator